MGSQPWSYIVRFIRYEANWRDESGSILLLACSFGLDDSSKHERERPTKKLLANPSTVCT
eukprot:3204482-Amphidinium_carterae.1